MKFFIFIISIIFINIFSKEQNEMNHEEKKKKKYIFEHYFISKIKNKSKRKIANYLSKGESDDLSNDFNYWEKMEYKDYLSNNKKNSNNLYLKNGNDKFIEYLTNEINVINGNYKMNDLITKFNNRKFNYNERIADSNSAKNNNLNEYKEKNHINQDNNANIIEKIKDIDRINKMNQMNNHHNPHRNPHSFNSEHFGKSSYYDSQNSFHSNQQHSNFQQFSTNSHKSIFSGYMGSFYQIIMVAGFFGLIYRLVFGNRQNDKYAMIWYDANIDYFKERYELIGLIDDEIIGSYRKPEGNLNTKSFMVKESIDNYQLICGNYRYIKYISINLHFMKKYDMNFFIGSFFHPIRDKITYKVSFNSVDPFGWVFCIAPSRQSKAIKQSYEDLDCFCQIYHPHFMDEEMCLISEDVDVIKDMFNNNKKLMDYYRRIEFFIDNIYYSDSINSYFDENNIYFTFDIDLNASYQERIYLEITHFVNLFVDSLAQIKFSDEFKTKVKNNREQYKENKFREENKEEIEAKEKKEFIDNFIFKNQLKGKSPSQRKKLEKKQRKKNHK